MYISFIFIHWLSETYYLPVGGPKQLGATVFKRLNNYLLEVTGYQRHYKS